MIELVAFNLLFAEADARKFNDEVEEAKVFYKKICGKYPIEEVENVRWHVSNNMSKSSRYKVVKEMPNVRFPRFSDLSADEAISICKRLNADEEVARKTRPVGEANCFYDIKLNQTPRDLEFKLEIERLRHRITTRKTRKKKLLDVVNIAGGLGLLCVALNNYMIYNAV